MRPIVNYKKYRKQKPLPGARLHGDGLFLARIRTIRS
jgi:hypothetical protein